MTQKSPLLPSLASADGNGCPAAFAPLLSVLLPIEQGDDEIEMLDAACDCVFETLGEDEKAAIHQRAVAMLPEFLQVTQSEPGAKRGILKEKRAEIWSRHKAAVYAALEKGEG